MTQKNDFNFFYLKGNLRKNDDADDHGGHSDQERGTFDITFQGKSVDYVVN